MKKSKIVAICVAIVLTLSTFFLTGFTQANSAIQVHASTSGGTRLFANRYVMDDLREATLECGRPFDERDFPYTPNLRQVRMLHLVEYAFSYHARHRTNFGLFVYLWNPARLEIVPHSPQNTIQMATRYDANGRPDLYSKLPLRFLSRSTGNVAGLFYKFEIVIEGEHRASLMARLSANMDNRQYDISGIELTLRPNFVVRDFYIGRTYRFRGFARGHGELPNTESTLEVQVDGLRTISLNVHPTWYRTLTSDRGAGYQHQVNSVWFSVPNYILEEYGRLQRIMAEWWEFQTQPIIVTSRRSLYDRYRPIVGQHVGRQNNLRYMLALNYWESGIGLLDPPSFWGADWVFNPVTRLSGSNMNFGATHANFIYYLFHVNNIERYENTGRPIGRISSEQLADWIFNYNASNKHGWLPVAGDRQISADLFTDTIDAHRIANGINRGHNLLEIDARHTFNLPSFWGDGSPSGWDRFVSWFTGRPLPPTELSQYNITPIQDVSQSNMSMTNAQLSRHYLVRVEDIPALRSAQTNAQANNETLFLFRFAVTDYFSNWLTIINRDSSNWIGIPQNQVINSQAFKAQQTIFLDFDIIQLTFYGEFGYIVIPVVSDPIDVIGDVTPPTLDPPRTPDWLAWFRALLALILLILLLVLLMPFFPLIASIIAFLIKFALAVIFLPFRVLGKLFKRKRRRGGGSP